MKQEEILIRTPQVFGNGAHISVPKYWLGSEITLIKPKQRSVKEKIISLIEPYFDSILGVYLYGSHARGEQREDSDIDLLIISDKNLKLKADGFEIYCLQEKMLERAVSLEPVLIYSMLAEAKPIINSALLETIRKKYKPKKADFSKFLKECTTFYKINKEAIANEKDKTYSGEAIVYSLMLRLRGLFIINSLLSGETYTNKIFLSWLSTKLPDMNSKSIYESYLLAKQDKPLKENCKVSDLLQLLGLFNSELNELTSHG